MTKIKTAVIGVGYLGQWHAQKYAHLEDAQLMAVCDADINRAKEIASLYDNVEATTDYTTLIGQVDAVSIATPTQQHYPIALFFLKNGVHVLLEKPITNTIDEANALIAMAKKNNVLLQVGHLERFNNAITAVKPFLSQPRFIESSRTAKFQQRGTEVSVILDLMIHDIDIIQSIIKSDIDYISASGASVLSSHIDIANARIEFQNGCIANVTASRIALKAERKLHIFQTESFIDLDLNHKIVNYYSKGMTNTEKNIAEMTRGRIRFDKGDALKDQIHCFLNSIIHNKAAIVSGEDGKKALETAIRITQCVEENKKHFETYHQKNTA